LLSIGVAQKNSKWGAFVRSNTLSFKKKPSFSAPKKCLFFVCFVKGSFFCPEKLGFFRKLEVLERTKAPHFEFLVIKIVFLPLLSCKGTVYMFRKVEEID